MSHSHSHTHSHSDSQSLSGRKLFITILLNFLITIFQIAGGIISNSLSLLSDALHNLSDGIALLVSYVAFRIGKRDKNLRRTFGYKRAEILAALLNASTLLVISIFLFREALHRFQEPAVIDSSIMLIVAVFGLLANLAGVVLLKKDSHSNLNIKSAYIHLISDAISSVAVIIGATIIHFYKFYYIDSIFTILIGIYVLYQGYGILRETIDILMQSTPKDIDILKIKEEVEKIQEVDNIHHIHVWQTNDRDIFLEGHIDLKEDFRISEIDIIRKKINSLLKDKFQIKHITLQSEFDICRDKEPIAK